MATDTITDLQRDVLRTLKSLGGEASTQAIATESGRDGRSVSGSLRGLRSAGLIKATDKGWKLDGRKARKFL